MGKYAHLEPTPANMIKVCSCPSAAQQNYHLNDEFDEFLLINEAN